MLEREPTGNSYTRHLIETTIHGIGKWHLGVISKDLPDGGLVKDQATTHSINDANNLDREVGCFSKPCFVGVIPLGELLGYVV